MTCIHSPEALTHVPHLDTSSLSLCIYYLLPLQDTTAQHDELNNVTDAFAKLATFSTSAVVLHVLL